VDFKGSPAWAERSEALKEETDVDNLEGDRAPEESADIATQGEEQVERSRNFAGANKGQRETRISHGDKADIAIMIQ
jgi:hypothetical protein